MNDTIDLRGRGTAGTAQPGGGLDIAHAQYRRIAVSFTADNLNAGTLRLYDFTGGVCSDMPVPVYGRGPSGSVRDPSCAKIGDWFYIAYTSQVVNDGVARFAIARSKDLIEWQHVSYVSCAALAVTPFNVWAPELFVDGSNVYVVCAVNTGSVGTYGTFSLVLYQATNATLTAWNTGTVILGENNIDCFLYTEGTTYYAWVKNETTKFIEVYSAPAVTGPYTKIRAGDWAGWGALYEGQCLLKNARGDGYTLYADNYMQATGTHVATSASLLSGWSNLTAIPGAGVARHCTVVELPTLPTATPISMAPGRAMRLLDAALISDANANTPATLSAGIGAVGTGDVSMAGWVFIPESGTDGNETSFPMLIGGATGAMTLIIHRDATNDFRFRLRIVGTPATQSSPTLPLGRWVHIAATRASGVVRYYIDGALVTQFSQSLNATVVSDQVMNNAKFCMMARIVFLNVALSAIEVRDLYEREGIIDLRRSGLIYAMADAGKYPRSGTPIGDKTSGGRTLTLPAGITPFNPR